MPKNQFKEKYQNTNLLIPDPYDKRDYKFKDLVPVGAVKLPKNFESPELPLDKIFDQGQSSMCCACAFSSLRYMQESKATQSGITDTFSPTFTYGNRLVGEDFEGMYMRSCCKKAKQDGSLPISVLSGFYTYPICKELVKKNEANYKKLAKPFRISSYYQCNSRTQMQTAIVETGAILVGIYVFNCFYKPNKTTGKISYNPLIDIRNDGGHAILLTGYKEVRGKLYWRVLNSWGTEWGQHGYAWLPENYPMLPDKYAIVDNITEVKWKKYKEEHGLE